MPQKDAEILNSIERRTQREPEPMRRHRAVQSKLAGIATCAGSARRLVGRHPA
jgi:hypothetical protein